MVVGLLAWQQKSENSRISQNLAALPSVKLVWSLSEKSFCEAHVVAHTKSLHSTACGPGGAGRSSFRLRNNLARLNLEVAPTRSPLKTSFYLLFIVFLTRFALSAWARDLCGDARRVGRSHDLQQPEHMLDDGTNSGKWCHSFEGCKTAGNYGCNIPTIALSTK